MKIRTRQPTILLILSPQRNEITFSILCWPKVMTHFNRIRFTNSHQLEYADVDYHYDYNMKIRTRQPTILLILSPQRNEITFSILCWPKVMTHFNRIRFTNSHQLEYADVEFRRKKSDTKFQENEHQYIHPKANITYARNVALSETGENISHHTANKVILSGL